MLCRNSPFGRLNFFMLSADADANDFLDKSGYCNSFNNVDNRKINSWKRTHSFGCSAKARTDFLWCVRVHIVFPVETNYNGNMYI
jgi:hypothetical protein